MSMTVEDKYILLEDWTNSNLLINNLQESLVDNSLANVLIKAHNDITDTALAEKVNELLIENNGLACFYDSQSIKLINDLGLDCVIALPTKHEAVEAVMMNILENEFLSQGN